VGWGCVFPCFRDPKPLHGEEYNGQEELNGRVEHKSVVLRRGGGRGRVPPVPQHWCVFPCLRISAILMPLHGEEYNGQGELNGQGAHKSVEFDKSVVLG